MVQEMQKHDGNLLLDGIKKKLDLEMSVGVVIYVLMRTDVCVCV